jgi:Ca2+-binding RTX toxin-like protein
MATISGDGEPNELRGTAGSDFIYGGGGDDYIDGRGGGDNLYGGGNGDYIAVFTSDAAYGDGGNDTLGTVGSPMVLSGGDGNDTIAMQSTTNLSNTVIQGIEVLSLYSTLYLRADQCGTIPKFTSYGRTGHIILTEGGTAQLELD